MALVLLPVWFFLVLPLTLLIPDKSFLWKSRILSIIGLFAGPLICGAYQASNLAYAKTHTDLRIYEPPVTYILHTFYPFGFMSVFIGFTTCLVSAKLHDRLVRRATRLDIPARNR